MYIKWSRIASWLILKVFLTLKYGSFHVPLCPIRCFPYWRKSHSVDNTTNKSSQFVIFVWQYN